jgi:hypothetical protein
MIYIASLCRNGLVKIGKSRAPSAREKQLRRELKAEGLKIFRAVYVPHGWGTDAEWESELLGKTRRQGGELQLFSSSEESTEVADCSPDVVWACLKEMLSRTEIDESKDALDHDDEKVDWRFYWEFSSHPGGAGYLATLWRSLCYRQRFINSLRGDSWAIIPEEFIEIDRERGF